MRHQPSMALLVAMTGVAALQGSASADVLYDRTDMTDNLTYDSIVTTGLSCLFGFCSDPRVADDFVLAAPHTITSVTADLGADLGVPPVGATVEFYEDLGGRPAETPFATAFGNISTTPIPNSLAVWGANNPGTDGYRTVLQFDAGVALEPGTWWVSLVARNPDDASIIIRDSSGANGAEIHVRDGDDPMAILTKYGATMWTPYSVAPMGTDGFPGGDIAIKIEGTADGASSCACELTGDEPAAVDVFDLLAYLDLWFVHDAAADVDASPGVDVFDLLAYLDCWFPASAGSPCP